MTKQIDIVDDGVIRLHRWRVEIEYRTDEGSHISGHSLEEISELDRIIENGPDWNTIIKCTVTLLRDCYGGQLTIEMAEKL